MRSAGDGKRPVGSGLRGQGCQWRAAPSSESGDLGFATQDLLSNSANPKPQGPVFMGVGWSQALNPKSGDI